MNTSSVLCESCKRAVPNGKRYGGNECRVSPYKSERRECTDSDPRNPKHLQTTIYNKVKMYTIILREHSSLPPHTSIPNASPFSLFLRHFWMDTQATWHKPRDTHTQPTHVHQHRACWLVSISALVLTSGPHTWYSKQIFPGDNGRVITARNSHKEKNWEHKMFDFLFGVWSVMMNNNDSKESQITI